MLTNGSGQARDQKDCGEEVAFHVGCADLRGVGQPGKGHSRHREHTLCQRQEITIVYLENEERLGVAAAEYTW